MLPNGTEIRILSPSYFLAAKIEAFEDRGSDDPRTSADFEDLIYVLDNREELLGEIRASDPQLREYLREECEAILTNPLLFGSDRICFALRFRRGTNCGNKADDGKNFGPGGIKVG